VEDVRPVKKGFQAQISASKRKASRPSRPALVLESIQNEARSLYSTNPVQRDLAYTSRTAKRSEVVPRPTKSGLSTGRHSQPQKERITLHSVLARYIYAATTAPWEDTALTLTTQETSLLRSQGYSTEDVATWTTCVLTPNSAAATAIFRSQTNLPPLFLVLLVLRRKRLHRSALGVIMRHMATRKQSKPLTWPALKILIIRLLRHARAIWPESIPWIVSLFCTEATLIMKDGRQRSTRSATLLRDMTHFCNKLLSLISLPTSTHPLMNSVHQEKAQFQVLHFMQSCDPAIVMTRGGFRAIARNQLMHSKTVQEREWATLKGPSWPPWKEARTAMDDEKGYEFGASRASRILHRMYEAGYEGRTWEEVVEMYAGWDTDMSPTIQTRTPLPRISKEHRSSSQHWPLLWAARIRTTRTRREAWACFLSHEASGASGSPEVYFAMFEKLHYSVVHRSKATEQDSFHAGEDESKDLLPGDMKEVEADPRSPLHLVYLSEPIPTYDELYRRMIEKQVWPTPRFLAFLVETHPDFSTTLKLLETHKTDFDGGLQFLLQGQLPKLLDCPLPGYFIGAFVRFLCRFGCFFQAPQTNPINVPSGDHEQRLQEDRHYLLEYAYALLMHIRPSHRPAWTSYMQKILFSPYTANNTGRATQSCSQYRIMCNLFEQLKAIDLEPDDDQFRLLSTVVRHATQAAMKRDIPVEDMQHVLSTAPRLLRTVFHTLVAANIDPNATGSVDLAIPPHVPDPAALHTYVRALGVLRDYEGLYSFSTWITTYHAEVTARANAQRSGWQALYRTFLALRAALDGSLTGDNQSAPADLTTLIREQMEGVEGWGWPPDEHVDIYVNNRWRLLGDVIHRMRTGG
jgi:hypothetical protein